MAATSNEDRARRGRSEPHGEDQLRPATDRRTGRARLVVGYLAIGAIVPYLALKLGWIAGSTVGIVTPSPADAAVVHGGNIITALMEVVAVAVILVFTHASNSGLPAWLVLAPTWVATGLLAPFVITGPAVAVSVLTGASVAGDGSLAVWVGPLVYLGFGAQAIGISASFVLYVRDRWPDVLRGRIGVHHPGSHQSVLVPFGWLTAIPLMVVALIRAIWAMGATVGLSPQLSEGRGAAERLADAGVALFAIGAAIGMLALILRRPPGCPTWIPIALAWIGGGAVFGGGLYAMVLVLAASAGTGVATTQSGVVPFVDLLQVVTGTAIAVVGAFVLAELNTRDRTPPRVSGA